VWAGPWCYRFIKTWTAQEVAFTDVPASQKIRLSAGQACIVRLPGGKTVALWCTEGRGNPALDDGDFAFHFGETPFKELEYEHIELPDGSTTSGEGVRRMAKRSVQELRRK
jgi:hypothetical protein